MSAYRLRVALTLLLACAAGPALAQEARRWVDPPANLTSPPPPEAAPAPTPAPAPAAGPSSAEPAEAAPARRAARPPARETVEVPASPRPAVAARPVQEATRPAPQRRTAATDIVRRRPAVRRADPSFNCDYARTLVERMICADPTLAAKDRRMALLYEEAGGSRHRPVDSTQWRWLSARNSCGRVPLQEVEACLDRIYDARIAELSAALR